MTEQGLISKTDGSEVQHLTDWYRLDNLSLNVDKPKTWCNHFTSTAPRLRPRHPAVQTPHTPNTNYSPSCRPAIGSEACKHSQTAWQLLPSSCTPDSSTLRDWTDATHTQTNTLYCLLYKAPPCYSEMFAFLTLFKLLNIYIPSISLLILALHSLLCTHVVMIYMWHCGPGRTF